MISALSVPRAPRKPAHIPSSNTVARRGKAEEGALVDGRGENSERKGAGCV